MKNLKRFMAGALALIMVMGMTLTVSATETNSVPSIEGRYVVKELDEKALEGVPAADRSAIEAVSKGDATDTFSSAIVDAGTSPRDRPLYRITISILRSIFPESALIQLTRS